MLRIKILMGLAVMMVILIAVTSTALAAPNADVFNPEVTVTPAVTASPTASLTGTVQSITPITDANNVTTFQVTLLDQNNVTQTVTLSQADAIALGLASLDANNMPTVNAAMVGQTITVQSPTVTPTPTPTETAQNPVGAVIASFFGLDYPVVDQLHQEGTGYGVIAQACWMSYQLNGDASSCADIAEAKKTGDFSAFTLSDGATATNWGQFKKALSDHKGPGQTLGAIVSGHANAIGTPAPDGTPSADGSTTFSQPGNGNGNPNHPGNGNGNGNANGKDPNKKNNGKGPKK